MSRRRGKFIVGAVLAAIALLLVVRLLRMSGQTDEGLSAERLAPVAVAPVERGPITLYRTFTGAMEANSSFAVASKVGGRIEAINVDISDPVERGQIVAQLDDAEYLQDVAQAEADLAVAKANLAEATSLAEIATREIDRFDELRDSGFTSQSVFETAEAERLAREAQVKVAEAQITRAEAALASARIRLGYTRITADWVDETARRVVAERFLDEGDTASANTAILRVVGIDQVIAVIYVTERDYARLRRQQPATLVTDAYPDETFAGSIERIAPVFREATRQARVELRVQNEDHRLKPGMFARVELVLDRKEDTTIVPEAALTRRAEVQGVFVLPLNSDRVRWVPVRTGLREAGRVEVLGEGLEGRVVILGQQLVEDGSRVTIPVETTTVPTS